MDRPALVHPDAAKPRTPAQPADWDNAQVLLSGVEAGSLIVTIGDIDESLAMGLSIATGAVLWTSHFNDRNFQGPAIRADRSRSCWTAPNSPP